MRPKQPAAATVMKRAEQMMLSARNRIYAMLLRRYQAGQSTQEIAKMLGVSRQRAHQILAATAARLGITLRKAKRGRPRKTTEGKP